MQLLSLDAELLFPLRQFPFSAQTLGFSYEMKHLKHSKFQTKYNVCEIRANLSLKINISMLKSPKYGSDIILNLYVVAQIYRHLANWATSLLKGRIKFYLKLKKLNCLKI